jgi:hypothetical protein
MKKKTTTQQQAQNHTDLNCGHALMDRMSLGLTSKKLLFSALFDNSVDIACFKSAGEFFTSNIVINFVHFDNKERHKKT